jgi:hypothetical protein
MRTHRFAIVGVALVASTILVGCGSDDGDAPVNSGVPIVADSTIETTATLPIADTTIDDSSLTSVNDPAIDDSNGTTLP